MYIDKVISNIQCGEVTNLIFPSFFHHIPIYTSLYLKLKVITASLKSNT